MPTWTSNIPSQVKTYANVSAFPATGSVKTIYIAEDTDIAYYWTGSAYQSISIQDLSGLVPYTGSTTDVDLGNNDLNAEGIKIKGTAGNGHLGMKHQTSNPTASGQETVIFAGADGEPRFKNDGNAVEQFASREWVNLQGFQTTPIVVNANITAQNDSVYHVVASATFIDPTPVEGKGYRVFVRNGTAVIGGTSYSVVGTIVVRIFHSGSWITLYYFDYITSNNLFQSRANLSTNVNTDQASNAKYPSVKAVFDWVVGLFVPQTRTINGLDLTVDRTLTTANINDSTNRRYVTDAQLTVIGNTSGTNTGDQDLSGLVPNTRTVNGKALSSNITLTPSDIGSPSGSGTSSGTNTGDQDLSGLMVKANNLSDLTNTSTARTNLGLGTLATQSGTFSGTSSGTNTGDETQSSILSKLGWVRKIQKGGTVTGTTFETIVYTFAFTANEYPASSILHIESQFVRTGTPVANGTIRVRINTSNTLVGSTQISQGSMGGNSNVFSQFRKKFNIESGLIEGFASGSSVVTDLTTSTLTPLSTPLDTTQDWWLFVTYSPNNSGDTAICKFSEVKNF